MKTEIKMTAAGRVKVLIVNRDGSIALERPWQKNLILNLGLNNVCNVTMWADQFLACCAGTGTTATSVASGAGITATGAATTFTNTTPGTFNWTTNSAVGDMIKMTSGANSGLEARITAIGGVDSVTYTPSQTMAIGEFAVYKTSQTGLTTEVKRTTTYLTGASNCFSSLSGSIVTMQRTYDFTAEVGSVTYNELGFANSGSAGSNLFSRIKLSSGVALVAGQSLRVVYSLAVTISPTTSQPKTFSISGWPVSPATTTDGDESVIQPGIAGVNNAGSTNQNGYASGASNNGGLTLEPTVSSNIQVFVSPSSAVVSTFAGTNATRTTNMSVVAVTLSTYVALDFFRDKSGLFAVGSANRTDFRSMGMGTVAGGGVGAGGDAIEAVFDEAQTKDSIHTLTLTWRITVGRTLA